MSPVPVGVTFQMLGLAWKILKLVAGHAIIKKALDNWSKGTTNEVDDWVWKWLKKKMKITEELDPVVLEAEVTELQNRYDAAKNAGIITSLKEPVRSWDMAALVIEGESWSGNIG